MSPVFCNLYINAYDETDVSIVKRYAIHKAKIRAYAARRLKIRSMRYARSGSVVDQGFDLRG